jgi:hypothetical protein
MKDYKASMEKLRKEAAEYALIRDLATEPAKRQMFARLAEHLTALADQVERELLTMKGCWLEMAKLKPGRSLANDRALVEMSKTMDLAAIAKKTGRKPEAVLKIAKRLGVSIKGREAPCPRPSR